MIEEAETTKTACATFLGLRYQRGDFPEDKRGDEGRLTCVLNPMTAYALAETSLHNAIVAMFKVRERLGEEGKEKLKEFVLRWGVKEGDFWVYKDGPRALNMLEEIPDSTPF